jgi:hypothetical protein
VARTVELGELGGHVVYSNFLRGTVHGILDKQPTQGPGLQDVLPIHDQHGELAQGQVPGNVVLISQPTLFQRSSRVIDHDARDGRDVASFDLPGV